MLSKKDFDDSWEAIEDHISKRKRQKKNRYMIVSSIATAAIFLIMIKLFDPVTINQKSGHTHTDLVLNDNSKVYLNKNSSLEYPKSFQDKSERRVELKGEAFFDVKRNEQLPFRVTVDETEVEVLGTSFNIRSRQSENQIEVFVNSGKVQFGKGTELVILTPNEVGVYDKASERISKKTLEDNNSLAWHSKKLTFESASFLEVEKVLFKVFGYQLKVTNADIYNCAITSTIDFETVEDVLQILSATMGATFTLENDKITVTGNGC